MARKIFSRHLFRSKTMDDTVFPVVSPKLKISRESNGDDMLNLKKAALGFTNKFGLLNSHRSLVVAATEEKQVHEALFKLVLSRVNASTSLLRWAKSEANTDLRDCIHRLYDVNLMWGTVQREYAEQSDALVTSLKEIIQIEAGLHALQKHLKQVSEKKEKLQQRRHDVTRKKLEKQESISDEIIKLQDNEESLKSELEVKSIKAEIFKTTSLKSSLTKIADANLLLAEKMKLIFSTTKQIVDSLDKVPAHLKTKKVGEDDEPEPADFVGELASALDIKRPPSSSSLTRTNENISGGKGDVSSVFHVKLPKSSSLKNAINFNNDSPKHAAVTNRQSPVQKKISGAKFTFGIKKMFGMGNQTPPKSNDLDFSSGNSSPILLPGFNAGRRRSRSTVDPPTFIKNRKELNNNYDEKSRRRPLPLEESESDDSDEDPYIEPNPSPPRRPIMRLRSCSESTLDSIETRQDYGYSRPWDLLPVHARNDNISGHKYDTPEGIETPKYVYSRAYDHMKDRNIEDNFSPYQDPRDCIMQNQELYNDLSSVLQDRIQNDEKDLYDTPYDIKEQVEELYRTQSVPERQSNEAIYQNSLKLLDEIEYVDTDVFKRIQSRPDASSGHIVMEKKPPLLLKKEMSSTDGDNSFLSHKPNLPPTPTSPKPKKSTPGGIIAATSKPKPSPRPRSTYNQLEQNILGEGAPNARQLQPKVRPTATVPNLTQAKMAASDRISYENNFNNF